MLSLFALICPASFAEPIISDYTCTEVTQIPDYWLEKAKQLTIHYAHTSHDSQINSRILNHKIQNIVLPLEPAPYDLDTLNQFENEYPGIKFIYMTGHLAGTGSTRNLHARNEQIRNYCIANNKVLNDRHCGT